MKGWHDTGYIHWTTVMGIPGALFSGSLDGHLRAYSTANGKILWD